MNFEHPLFLNRYIDPSQVIPHSCEKLYNIWRDIQTDYCDVVKRFMKY